MDPRWVRDKERGTEEWREGEAEGVMARDGERVEKEERGSGEGGAEEGDRWMGGKTKGMRREREIGRASCRERV